jgi:hypothetical protein
MKDIIAARRQAIQDSAPCDGCGSTLAACKANQGKDPTAPPWFGCCARGVGLDIPCNHVPDAGALLALLVEIESGTVRTVEEATPKPAKGGIAWDRYLDQGVQWKPNGRPMAAVTDMDPEWRFNASRWLERNAAKIAPKCTLDRGAERQAADPVEWIRTTALYRALVADLPNCSVALDAIAERARHWSTCPARTGGGDCRCEAIAAQCQRCRDGHRCLICNGDGCGSCPDCSPEVPEWTS